MIATAAIGLDRIAAPSYSDTEIPVSNPAWGTKRVCHACQAKFYDLNSEPAICPKCQVEFDPTAGLKSQPRNSFGGRAKSVFDKVATPLGIEEVAPKHEAADKAEDGEKEERDEDEDEEEGGLAELGEEEEEAAEEEAEA
jgi:uncharacterized protein (TIGR02300 family)